MWIRDGLPEFVPPRFVDPLRRPRRKALPQTCGSAAATRACGMFAARAGVTRRAARVQRGRDLTTTGML